MKFVLMLAAAVILWSSAASAAEAPKTMPAPRAVIAVIEINGKKIEVHAGEKAPKIKPGDKVTVVSGSLDLSTPNGTVVAGAGAAFSVVKSNGGVSVQVDNGTISVDGQTVNAGQSSTPLNTAQSHAVVSQEINVEPPTAPIPPTTPTQQKTLAPVSPSAP